MYIHMLYEIRSVAVGRILDIKDNIISVSGLRDAFSGELVYFRENNGALSGFILNLEKDICRVPLLSGDQKSLKIGDAVYRTKDVVKTMCGFGVLSEVINPMGTYLVPSAISKKQQLTQKLFKTRWSAVEVSAPGISKRSPVSVPFMTGIVAIDCFLPIGCGQRELIIGDHNTGKTSLAITSILNQSFRNNSLYSIWNDVQLSTQYNYSFFVPCVYVSIGGKRSEFVRLRKVLAQNDALHYTCMLFASADDLAALQYIAPFAGCTIGEWFMRCGLDAVVIYDDLTQHAIAYRQMALLLRRPPGREAFPGDIFFVHSRLLERAAQLATGGSLTALPIVQTFGGDLTGYISTNIISITDGQIFLVETLFNSGIKPAIDLNLSVSRVGSAAQFKAMDFVSRRVKQIANMHRMFSTMSKVGGSGFDFAVHVARGERLIEFLKQNVYVTYTLYKQVFGLYALSLRNLDRLIPRYVHCFFEFISIKD